MLVTVWVATGEPGATFAQVLDDDERRRAARLVHPADRAAYVAAHAALRHVTGALLDVPPELVSFDRTCAHCGEGHGRPRVPGAGFDVSLAHTRGLALVAVATEGVVGVDLEPEGRDLDGVDIALSPSERARYDTLPAADRNQFLLAAWTVKEAYVKATGEGLARDLTTVEVTNPTGSNPGLADPGWWAARVPVPAGYTAAVVADRLPGELRVRDWRPE